MSYQRIKLEFFFPILFLLLSFILCISISSKVKFISFNRTERSFQEREILCIGGNSEWNRTWGVYEEDFEDIARSVTRDSIGNYFIVGDSNNDTSSYDIGFLLKYDVDGNYIWNQTWHGNGIVDCRDVAVDSSNDIYVTGSIRNNGISVVNTLKFNSTGKLEWNSTWGGEFYSEGLGITIPRRPILR